MRKPFVTERLIRLAKKIGAKILVEPEYGFVGHITFKNGKKSLFKDTSFNINPYGSVQIAKDKGYAAFFLRKFGYPVPKDVTVFTNRLNDNIKIKRNLEDGYKFAKKIGFPVVVKPNDKSKGEGVAIVYNKKEYQQAAKKIFKENKVMLVQQYCKGKDYRVVVLNGEVISAYQRIPLTLVGDGRSTMDQLLKRKQKEFTKSGRDTVIDFNDYRISQNLSRKGLKMTSILEQNESVDIISIANLSAGGSAIDVTDSIHPDFKAIAIKATKDMCLKLCGVDILTDDITNPPEEYYIIEINAAPGLDNYAFIGRKQDLIVDGLYLKILNYLEKD